MKTKKPKFKIGDVVHPNFIPGSNASDYPCSFVPAMRMCTELTITRIDPVSWGHDGKFSCWWDGFVYRGNEDWTWSSPMFLECQEI